LDGGCPIVVPVNSEKSAHIKKQNIDPPKQVSRTRLPTLCRSSVNATPQMSSAYYSTNNVQQQTCLPLSPQQRIYKMINDNRKVTLQNFSKMCSLDSGTF